MCVCGLGDFETTHVQGTELNNNLCPNALRGHDEANDAEGFVLVWLLGLFFFASESANVEALCSRGSWYQGCVGEVREGQLKFFSVGAQFWFMGQRFVVFQLVCVCWSRRGMRRRARSGADRCLSC